MPYPSYPPQSLLNESTTPPLLTHRGRPRRVSTLTGRLTTASSFIGLHHGCCWSGRVLDGRLLRCDKANGENAASSARARWSRLKIATDVVGVIELSVPRRPQVFWSQSMQRPFVLGSCDGYQQRSAWDLVQLRVRLGQWRKCLTVASYRGTPGWILLPAVSGKRRVILTSRSLLEWTCQPLVRAASLRRQPIWNVSPHFRRVVWVENASSGCRTTRQTGISMSHSPSGCSLPECLRYLVMMRSICHFAYYALASSITSPGSFLSG
jgi:hypothetical protein